MIPFASTLQRRLQRRLSVTVPLNGPDNHRKLPLPVGGSARPSKAWFLGPPESSCKTACRSVQPFCTAHRRVSHYFTVHLYVFPQNSPFPLGDRHSHVRHCLSGQAHSSCQTASRSVQPFFYGSKMFCCTMHINPQNCPFALGFRHPAEG